MTTTACASGCGRESMDACSFLVCSKCKSARYCSKTCQIEHWKKGGHKYECFAPEANNASFGCNFTFCVETIPRNWPQLCREATNHDSTASSIFLGRNKNAKTHRNHPYMILTDLPATQNSYVPIDDRLVLPKVPPALVDPKNHSTRQHDLYSEADASGLGKKLDLTPDTTPEDFEKLLTVDDTVWKSVFLDGVNETTRGETLQFIDKLLKFYQWSSFINVPREEGDSDELPSIVGKKIVLGGGIEMVYLTAPGICFANLSESEKSWFGVRHYHIKPPVLRLPVVIYQSQEEGWYTMRINRINQITAHEKKEGEGSDNLAIQTFYLKVFIAGAEIGDTSLLFGEFFESAAKAAVSKKQELIFAAALKKLIAVLHPHHKREQAFFLLKLGEVYEALASRLLRDRAKGQDSSREALLSAALTYKAAADLTRQFYPFIGLRLAAYLALAMSLVRLGDLEMATRAFIWAYTDPNASKGRGAKLLHQNMEQVWEHKLMSVDERAQSNKQALKSQRAQVKTISPAFCLFKVYCSNCSKIYSESCDGISRCKRCLAPYCSQACQKSHWQKHRDSCIPVQITMESFEKYTHCPDETCTMLASMGENIINKEFGMPLADWSLLVDQYHHASANQQILHPEAPASLTRLIYENRAWSR